MLKESQIKQILSSLAETDNGFNFHTVDRTIYLYIINQKGADFMILNYDCVRSILLAVEASPRGKRVDLNTLQRDLPDYGRDDIHYACIKLNEAKYLNMILSRALRSDLPTIVKITDITFAGHEFLNSIRDDNNWGKVKEAAKGVGATSLRTLADIALEVAKAAILSSLQFSR